MVFLSEGKELDSGYKRIGYITLRTMRQPKVFDGTLQVKRYQFRRITRWNHLMIKDTIKQLVGCKGTPILGVSTPSVTVSSPDKATRIMSFMTPTEFLCCGVCL